MVDTLTWLRGGRNALLAQQGRDGKTTPSVLFRLLVCRHPRNVDGDNCRDSMDNMSVDAPYPSGEGLVFDTVFAHAVRACNDEIRLDWKQLAPYLSEAGRAAMQGAR